MMEIILNRQMMELSKACSPFINGVDPPALLSLLFSFFFSVNTVASTISSSTADTRGESVTIRRN